MIYKECIRLVFWTEGSTQLSFGEAEDLDDGKQVVGEWGHWEG